MRESRGHRAERRKLLSTTHLLLQLKDLGQILKDEHDAANLAGLGRQRRHVEPEVRELPVRPGEADVRAQYGNEAMLGMAQVLGRQIAEEVAEGLTDERRLGVARDLLRRDVTARDRAVEPGGDEPAAHRVDDAVVERLEVCEVPCRGDERRVASALAVGQVHGEDRDRDDGDRGIGEVELKFGDGAGRIERAVCPLNRPRERGDPEPDRRRDRRERDDDRVRRRQKARREDDDEVERVERRFDVAGPIDEPVDEQEVVDDLDGNQHGRRQTEPERGRVDEREREADERQQKDRPDVLRRRPQQERHADDDREDARPRDDDPGHAAVGEFHARNSRRRA